MARAPRMFEVKPVAGRRVMRHDRPGTPITKACSVPKHPHYTRAIARGDLEEVVAAKTEAPKTTGKAGKKEK